MIDSGTRDGCMGAGVLLPTAGSCEGGCREEVGEGTISVATASETETVTSDWSAVVEDLDEIWVSGTLVVIL